jgi:hypothetical protein
MPFILVITFVIVALGLGGYFWESSRTDTVTTTETSTPTTVAPNTATHATAFKNGTYSAEVTYLAPDTVSYPLKVTLTLENDIVTASEITYPKVAEGVSADYQKQFATTYKTKVVGQPLTAIKLSRVGGASLTTNAWNDAQKKITAQAKS